MRARAQAKRSTANSPAPQPKLAAPQPTIEYLQGWAVSDASARATSNTHQTRLVKTLEITPPGGPDDRMLEMGAYLQITPALRTKLGYGEVRGCYYGKLGRSDHRTVHLRRGRDASSARSITSMPRRTPFPTPTRTSPP